MQFLTKWILGAFLVCGTHNLFALWIYHNPERIVKGDVIWENVVYDDERAGCRMSLPMDSTECRWSEVELDGIWISSFYYDDWHCMHVYELDFLDPESYSFEFSKQALFNEVKAAFPEGDVRWVSEEKKNVLFAIEVEIHGDDHRIDRLYRSKTHMYWAGVWGKEEALSLAPQFFDAIQITK